MKHLFKIAAVASALAFTSNLANANDKIGFADANFLMQNHPLTLEASEKFAKFMKASEEKFAPQEKKLAEENKKLAEDEKALVAERKKIESDAQALQKEQTALEASMKKKIAQLEKDAPRSIQVQAPISTQFPIITPPVCGILIHCPLSLA